MDNLGGHILLTHQANWPKQQNFRQQSVHCNRIAVISYFAHRSRVHLFRSFDQFSIFAKVALFYPLDSSDLWGNGKTCRPIQSREKTISLPVARPSSRQYVTKLSAPAILKGLVDEYHCTTFWCEEVDVFLNVIIKLRRVWLSVSWSYRWAGAGCVCEWRAGGPDAPAAGSELCPDGPCGAGCPRSRCAGTPGPKSGSATLPAGPGCSTWGDGSDGREEVKREGNSLGGGG